jgi:hypothetical protein
MSTEKNSAAEPMTPEANARVFYELTARILIRAFALGAGLLLLWLVIYLLLDKAWVAELHSKFMGTTITAQQLGVGELNYYGLGATKLFIYFVFLVPWLAIRWALKKNPIPAS